MLDQPKFRALQGASDQAEVKRIWREVGWITDAQCDKALELGFSAGNWAVAEVSGGVECSVQTVAGTMALKRTPLPTCVVAAVTTGRLGRGQALAQRLTARQVALAAMQGDAVATLGMFDQGFYDKLGFGTGGYTQEFQIDPGALDVPYPSSQPQRLTMQDHAAMHAALSAHPRNHGSVSIPSPAFFYSHLAFEEESNFGLGFYTDSVLTHFIWLRPKGENGPYFVRWMGYQNGAQLIELLGLLRSLADQVYAIALMEPPEIQLQSILQRPFRHMQTTKHSDFAGRQKVDAWYQLRILDIPQCVAAIVWQGTPAKFVLDVTDPIETILRDQAVADSVSWFGVAGRYLVELGATSKATRIDATDAAAAPVMRCSVNALSRLLWGVNLPSYLPNSDDLQAPASLLLALDPIFAERPHPFWVY